MSKHNYSQYSNKNKNDDNTTNTTETVEVEQTFEPVVETTDSVIQTVAETPEVQSNPEPETVTGVVVDCSKLNVRAYPSTTADIVCLLDANTEVVVDVDKTTIDWVCVCTPAGVDGYCMRKYVSVSL